MKKTIRNLSVILVILAAFVFNAFAFTACSGNKVERLKVENAKTTFVTGDEFDLGSYKVYAVYTNGEEIDVTAEASIKKENGFDMNVEGSYQITFSYGGKKEVVEIYVNSVEPILIRLAINTDAVKTTYELGEEISFDGLKVISTYQNAQGKNYELETDVLKEFTLKITDPAGAVVNDDYFSMLGAYTVSVSKSGVEASFTVNVEGVNISTVQGAIAAGRAFKSEVKNGDQTWSGKSKVGSTHINASYDYEFGNKYANIKADNHSGLKEEFFYGVDDLGAFAVRYENGDPAVLGQVNSEMINGAPVFLWYNRRTEYGVEAALAHLYNEARKCTNKDLDEGLDEITRSYWFSFSGLVAGTSAPDYYETDVLFELDDNYIVKKFEVTQNFYENNSAWAEGIPTFITDENGITRPNGEPTYVTTYSSNQFAGERTAENPYTRDSLNISDYIITKDGEEIKDGDVIKCDVTDGYIELVLSDIQPVIAGFVSDPLKIKYDNGYNNFQDGLSGIFNYDLFNLQFSSVYNSNTKKTTSKIKITLKNGGKFKIVLKTEKTLKTLMFDVTGLPPATMSAKIYNANTQMFYDNNKKTISMTGAVVFYGAVDKYKNGAQTATVVSDNAEFAKIEKTEINGEECFKFTATQNGVYTVETVSDVAPAVKCVFTFTVSDMPDFESVLTGTYKTEPVNDTDLSVYTVVFTQESAGDSVSGSVTITRTPTAGSGSAQTETLSFTVDFDNIRVKLTHVSGTAIGADLVFSDDGELMLEDRYGKAYKLNVFNN